MAKTNSETNDSTITIRLTEYSTLRTEILQRMKTRGAALAFAVALSGVALTLRTQDISVLFLLGVPIIIPFLALSWSHNDLRIAQIAEYIRANIEAELPSLKWEQKINELRQNEPVRNNEIIAGSIFPGVQIFAVALALVDMSIGRVEILLFLCDAGALIATFWIVRMRYRHG